jgi:hypothetical protein
MNSRASPPVASANPNSPNAVDLCQGSYSDIRSHGGVQSFVAIRA